MGFLSGPGPQNIILFRLIYRWYEHPHLGQHIHAGRVGGNGLPGDPKIGRSCVFEPN